MRPAGVADSPDVEMRRRAGVLRHSHLALHSRPVRSRLSVLYLQTAQQCLATSLLRLAGDASLLQQASFPCDRRPMQLHNTTLALSALQAAGVQLQAMPTSSGLVSLKPEDVIDGDRERTLSLLWAVARTLQLGTVLKVSSLKAEVHRVLARTRVSGRRPLLPLAASSGGGSRAAQQMPLAVYMHDELLSALQEWVQAVCAAYDVGVQNFTTCFGDGVVLCLLVSMQAGNRQH